MNRQRTAAILALIPITGGFGVHKFYLGYRRAGIIHILLGLTLLGVVVGVIEGVIYLFMRNEEFASHYITGKRNWF